VEKQKRTDHLATYALNVETYDWESNEQTFKKENERTEKSIYINTDTGEEITSKALIGSKANLLAIQQVIQQKLLDDAKKPQDILDAVLDLPRIKFENATYTPEHLEIALPKNKTGIDKLTLDYSDVQSFIQTDLVDPNQLSEETTALDPNKKYVSLTFDDGPGGDTTPRLLQLLAEKDVKATFFMLGQMAEEFPQIVKDVHEQGHEIASHSYSHPQLNAIPKDKLKEQVRLTDKAIYNAAGILPRTLRPPYGAISPESAEVIGKPIIQWDIDSYDWDSKNTQAVIDRVNQTAFEGGIILMHDIHPTTIDAVGTVIDNLRAQGYEFVTTSQLLEQKEKPLYQYFGQTDAREI
jgi:peptidoglycan/xylan/chitin deacetylase (PgdA/CDA1 family)